MSATEESLIAGPEDCPICGWDAATIKTDVHTKRCSAWQRACKVLDYAPMVRTQTEEIIDDSRAKMGGTENEDEVYEAGLAFVRALYDRSLGMAIDNDNALDHPPFQDYAGMLELPEFESSPILRSKFPLDAGHIAPGFTIWEPNGSKERRQQFRRAQQRNNNYN